MTPKQRVPTFRTIWPQTRDVPVATVIAWALDAIANGDSDIDATEAELHADPRLARYIVSDSGYATFARD